MDDIFGECHTVNPQVLFSSSAGPKLTLENGLSVCQSDSSDGSETTSGPDTSPNNCQTESSDNSHITRTVTGPDRNTNKRKAESPDNSHEHPSSGSGHQSVVNCSEMVLTVVSRS